MVAVLEPKSKTSSPSPRLMGKLFRRNKSTEVAQQSQPRPQQKQSITPQRRLSGRGLFSSPRSKSTPSKKTRAHSSSPTYIPTIVLDNKHATPLMLHHEDDCEYTTSTKNIPGQRLVPWEHQQQQQQHTQQQKEYRGQRLSKQLLKERDGFCRKVDSYDGQMLVVDGLPTYELGNYLGGGVAGVVYEGHRLRPMEEYPVRLGSGLGAASLVELPPPTQVVMTTNINSNTTNNNNDQYFSSEPALLDDQDLMAHPFEHILTAQNFLCMAPEPEPPKMVNVIHHHDGSNPATTATPNIMLNDRVSSLLTVNDGDDAQQLFSSQSMLQNNWSMRSITNNNTMEYTEDVAVEAIASEDQPILIDAIDAPSRSKHYAQAVVASASYYNNNIDDSMSCCDASFCNTFMEETVAIKILNPVGFRTLGTDVTSTAVVARTGSDFDPRMAMEESNVWWLIHPNSRNLRTLQRYSANRVSASSRRVEVERGSPDKGLRISLIAAYRDPNTRELKELPLTRCIEIWGHFPFGASDEAFKSLMEEIDQINQGKPPPVLGFGESTTISGSDSLFEEHKSMSSLPMTSKRTGIFRAASTARKTVYCNELNAYIALPAVPAKYLKWLRQRRAVTKEIRNMMRIGRHRNVVHLFEVLEFIQENKSTMFLVLELVQGGELFDLISSNAAKITCNDRIPPGFTENETAMRKFFRELASGIYYCHNNGIAHRDLKPENLLVHNSKSGACTLKIADFGLSASFGPSSQMISDNDTVLDSIAPDGASLAPYYPEYRPSDASLATVPPPKESKDKDHLSDVMNVSKALSFLTCGSVQDILECNCVGLSVKQGIGGDPSPLKRFNSCVGSPHYAAPEIFSQSSSKRSKNKDDPRPAGYDGTKVDVWSAGVILYAMLFRSLPFGEDLLRCPRYQSYKKWYDEVMKVNGRRRNPTGAMNPVITERDERDFLGPHWFFPSHSSAESRDLVIYMLNPDPDTRPNIQLILQHPWLLKEA